MPARGKGAILGVAFAKPSAMISGATFYALVVRGIMETAEEAGYTTEISISAGHHAMTELLAAGQAPTGVFAVTDDADSAHPTRDPQVHCATAQFLICLPGAALREGNGCIRPRSGTLASATGRRISGRIA